jgi:cytochrome c-type biogenesis protein
VSSSVDTTVLAAFAVGFISFVSPCVLPLVPGYLSAISGVSFADLEQGRGRGGGRGPPRGVSRGCGGRIAGVVIVLMGVLFIGTLFVPILKRGWRPEMLLRRASTGGPVVAGLAFAIAWLPCTGPTLGAILTAASTRSSVGEGGVLLAFYAAGLAVPFVLSALAFSRATRFFAFFRDHFGAITAVSGVVLIIMGSLLFAGELTRLNGEALTLMERLGINFFGEL